MADQDYTQDKAFMAAKPEEQHAYLMSVDPGYAKASADDQKAFLAHLAKSGGTTQAGAAKAAAQAPTAGDWLKSLFWLPKLSRTLGQEGEYLEGKRDEAELAHESQVFKTGKNPEPIAAYTKGAGYDLGARAMRMLSGASSPKRLAITGAAMIAPEIVGPALVAHGGYGMLKNARAALQGNPEAAEQALGGGAEAAGGAAATGAAIRSPEPTVTGNVMRAANRAIVKGQPPNALVPEAPKAMTQAIQPGVNIPRAQESIKIAGPRIQQLRQAGALKDLEGNPLTEIKNTGQQLGAIRSAKEHVLGAIEQRLGPVAEMQVDTSPIAEAMEKSVSGRTARQFPAVANAIKERAATYRGNLPLREVESSIQDANNGLRNFYKRPGASDSPTSADMEATLAEVKAARDLLDSKVEGLSGEGVKDLKREYGALRDVERATARQHAVATRTKEGGLWEGLSYLHAAGDLLSGNALGAARAGGAITVGRMLKNLRSPDFLIEQSFHGPKAFEAAEPIGRAPGPPAPRGLLPRPATEVGYTQEDTSGPVRGGRYTTPAGLLPEEKPINPQFLRVIPRGQGTSAPRGLLPESTTPETNIPPSVDPRFMREVTGRMTDENRLGARGQGGVRVPPRTRLTGVAESTIPDEARLLMRQTADMMKSGDRPGRYFDQSEQGDVRLRSRGAQFKGGDWRGVKSMRTMLEWANENEFTADEMEAGIKALEEGRTNNRVAQSAMEFIRRANKPRMREPGED